MHPQDLANRSLALAVAAEADGLFGTAAALREIGVEAWRQATELRQLQHETKPEKNPARVAS